MIQKLFILLIFFLIQTNPVYGKDYGYNHSTGDTPPEKKESHKKKILPLPRHIILKNVTYGQAPDIEGEDEVNFSEHRYWLVAIIASWNERSSDITRILNAHMREFERRDIGVIALFSQDTVPSVEKWRIKNKPEFDNFFASRNFIDSLKNPKVPSLWLVGSLGEILLQTELPTVQQIDATIEKAYILTSF